jgi:hypothetical protein
MIESISCAVTLSKGALEASNKQRSWNIIDEKPQEKWLYRRMTIEWPSWLLALRLDVKRYDWGAPAHTPNISFGVPTLGIV